jgi:Na+/melibiose symporter-like transporter
MLDALSPIHVFVITTLAGLVRPSDWAIRNALIGEIMPSGQLMGAMSVSRMTTDSARIAGALAGAGLVALLGMGSAYLGISGLHAVSFLLTLKVTGKDVRARRDEIGTTGDRAASSHWFELREGIAFVRGSPQLMAVMCLAMLVNMTAFPLSGGLLPYAAKEVYGLDRTGLSYLVAGFASGALAASIVLSATGAALRPARLMLTFVTLWYLVLLWFSLNQNVATGLALLVLAGFAHNFCMVPMAVIVLRGTSAAFRGRVMGVRSLAVYGMPVGLLAAGPLIEHFGFAVTGAAYCVVGLLSVAFIALRWRRYLWRVEAMANLR